MKTYRMQLIEANHEMPLEELLPRLFAEHGTNARVAKALGLSSMSLSRWLSLLGAEVRRERFVEHRTIVSFPKNTSAS